MRIRRSFLPPPKGSLMAFALLMVVVSGLFIAATASLMNTRALQTSCLDLAMKRRIAMENSKVFNQQFMLERTFNVDNTVAPNLAGLFGGDWGGVDTATGWTNLRVFASTTLPGTLTTVYPYNYAGFRPSSSYLTIQRTVRPAALASTDPYTGVDPFTAYAFLKTYAPGLGGDPLVVFRRPPDATNQIELANKEFGLSMRINGRAVIRDPDSFFAPSTANPYELPMRAKSLYIQKHSPTRKLFCKNYDGSEDLAPSNLAASLSTTGPTPEAVTAADLYDSTLNVINNPSNTDNSLWHFMDREKTAGTGDYVTINSKAATGTPTDPWYIATYYPTNVTQPLPPQVPPGYPAGYGSTYTSLYINLDHPNLPHMRIYGVVDQVVLVGQTGAAYTSAATLPPVIITVIPNGTSGGIFTKNFQCVNENNRRLILGVHHDITPEDLDLEFRNGTSASSTLIRWRMMLINEFRTISVYLPSSITKNVTITGGVMTNWSFKRDKLSTGSANRLTLAPETNPQPAGATGPLFSSLLPRDGWMENYFLPTPP